jgi:enoyl-CoA hydratase/carnithine racemase
MSEHRVRIEREDHVARVILDRPDKRNALDLAMFEAIDDAIGQVSADREVRAVVLAGEGRSFCAGLDLAAIAAGPEAIAKLASREAGGVANLAQRIAWGWRECPVPVIAALRGEVFGGGFQVAMGADIRIAGADARLSVMEVRWGLVPDMAGTQTLRRVVARDVALELTWTGRIVEADEARALGLVTRLAEDPLAAATELARQIASRSPDAVRAAKRLFDRAWEADTAEALALEEQLQRWLLSGSNQREAVRAGMAGEAPRFTPPRDFGDEL